MFLQFLFFPPRTHCQSHDFLVIQLLALLVKDNVYWFFYCSIDAPCVCIYLCVCVYACYLKLINFKYIPLIVFHMKNEAAAAKQQTDMGLQNPSIYSFFPGFWIDGIPTFHRWEIYLPTKVFSLQHRLHLSYLIYEWHTGKWGNLNTILLPSPRRHIYVSSKPQMHEKMRVHVRASLEKSFAPSQI
jgi:hypothetical protein